MIGGNIMQTCKLCNKIFYSNEALLNHNRAKHTEEAKKKLLTPIQKKKIKTWATTVVIIAALIGLVSFLISNIETFPPKDMEGHLEVSPPAHILKEPMSIAIHKHMLEHADGKEGGRGGVIINYNCEDFICEEKLVENLEAFATKYPAHVYVAPYPNMDAKIVLTKLNQQKVLTEFDESLIGAFVQ